MELVKAAKYEKYQHTQIMIAKAMNVARMLIGQGEEASLIKGFSMVTFASLNRTNKAKLA